jgi:hypothetical protein
MDTKKTHNMDYSAKINLFIGDNNVCQFDVELGTRLVKGDILGLENLIDGEMAYLYPQNEKMSEGDIADIRKTKLGEIDKILEKYQITKTGIMLEVTEVFVYTVSVESSHDFSAKVVIR